MEKKVYMYRLKFDVTESELKRNGFFKLYENGENMWVKIAKKTWQSDLPQYLVKKYYTNPEWIQNKYIPNKIEMMEKLDLMYDRKGRPIMSSKLKRIISSWRLVIKENEGNLYLTSSDPFDDILYNNQKLIDKYCEKQMDNIGYLFDIVEWKGAYKK